MWKPRWWKQWPYCAILIVFLLPQLSGGSHPLAALSTGEVSAANEIELLLNPRSLPSGSPETPDQLRSAFADPPSQFRSMPLWVWNDALEWPRLKEQLAQFKQQGIGGVFVHPRPGLMTEYLGSEWFRLWKLAMEEGQRLGLQVNIYDENSYPAGFSGGHVPARAPDTAAQFVQAEFSADAERVNFGGADLVSAFVVERGTSGKIRSVRRIHSSSRLATGESLLTFRLRRASGNPWTGGFPYVDLTNPQTASLFLETTLEPYRKEIGEQFGKTVKYVFDDEPLIATSGAYDAAPRALPLSRNTLAEFQKRCHYDLADHLASLYWDVADFQKIRFDYWQTLHDLWKENYFRPMFQWCDRNRLQFTGHWMEHEWPYPWISPADASLYAYEHVPGIDMLEGAGIRTRGSDPHMLFTIKQVASVAHQLGRRAFCEAYGVAGWDSTFEHYKRFGDWLLVHGINFIDQHLAFSTVRGARKRDHPQSFSDVSPWWPYYKLHGDYLGRVSYALSRGVSPNRLLLLEPTTSGFLLARRDGPTPELEKLRKEYGETVQFLADHQVDFDLADEYILEWFGKIEGRKLTVGKAAYDLLVWPANMINLRRQTLPLLARYLEAGGEVLALSEPAGFVDGRASEQVKDLAKRYANQWHFLPDEPSLLAPLHERLKPRVELDPPLQNVGLYERILPGGDRLLFFANTGLGRAKTKVVVEGGSLERWDSITGRIEAAFFQPAGNGTLRFDLDLPAAGSELIAVKNVPQPSAPKAEPKQFTALQTTHWQIRPDSPNVLVLDYCDLSLFGSRYSDINTWKANWMLWQMHGFDRPAWDNAVQFKTRVFDRAPFPENSGFVADFRFQVEDSTVLQDLELALESPELYRISLNGEMLSCTEGSRWLDPRIGSVSVGGIARLGDNFLKITGQPFDVRMELENIYLRGNFTVTPSEKGFRLTKRVPTQFGSWAKQGSPFFSGSVRYHTEVTVPAGGSWLRVDLGEWQGSVATISLDGKPPTVLGWAPYVTEHPVTPGKHGLEVQVVSTPRNVFGPFHHPAKPRMKAWPAAWSEFPEHQPAGTQYDVLDYGLMKPPGVGVSVPKKSQKSRRP